ncbi:MAG: RNA methyltransferase [Acidobacteriota bacterium]|nr:RNA methyltransferase [Acidobacteriota bacterium]MDH3528538.1 RNA methyltransferase [Acidobacteriota bacterium]
METIKSRANQNVKRARNVSKGKEPDFFFVEGKRLFDDLLASPIMPESVYVSVRFAERHPDQTESLAQRFQNFFLLTNGVFDSIADTKTPQGVAAVCRVPGNGRQRIEEGLTDCSTGVVVLLHGVSNPGNLGAVLRSAEAFGAAGAIITPGSAAPFSAASLRGSMGSAFRVPVWSGAGFKAAIDWSEKLGLASVCADRGAEAPLRDADLNRRILFVLGSEGHGISEKDRSLVAEQYCIPTEGDVESLNLSVAAGILLYEAASRRRS